MTETQKDNYIDLENKEPDQVVLRRLILFMKNAPPGLTERYNHAIRRFCKGRGISYESVVQDSAQRDES